MLHVLTRLCYCQRWQDDEDEDEDGDEADTGEGLTTSRPRLIAWPFFLINRVSSLTPTPHACSLFVLVLLLSIGATSSPASSAFVSLDTGPLPSHQALLRPAAQVHHHHHDFYYHHHHPDDGAAEKRVTRRHGPVPHRND